MTAPVYSHLIYDRIPGGDKTVVQPDILILEGLNVLQSGMDYPHDPHHVFVSDFVDFSIYVDAPEDLLQNWYINRFLKFREGAFTDPDSYFHHYAQLSEEEAINVATGLWNEINYVNLKENILPTRERASLILTKAANHAVSKACVYVNSIKERLPLYSGAFCLPVYCVNYAARAVKFPRRPRVLSPHPVPAVERPCASIPRAMPCTSRSPISSFTGRLIKLSSVSQRDRNGASPSCSNRAVERASRRLFNHTVAASLLRSMAIPASCRLIQP